MEVHSHHGYVLVVVAAVCARLLFIRREAAVWERVGGRGAGGQAKRASGTVLISRETAANLSGPRVRAERGDFF